MQQIGERIGVADRPDLSTSNPAFSNSRRIVAGEYR